MDLLTKQEIEEFKQLTDVQVVFDVGARESIEYLELRPEASFHLFEPVVSVFHNLMNKVKALEPFLGTVYLNNYALGDVIKSSSFNFYLQAFMDGVARPGWGGDADLPIKTLDWYIESNNITRIDFLKIDTEGYDLKVLQGGKKAIELARYIQFEEWDNLEDFKSVLGENQWSIKDIGCRNFFCTRK